MSDEIDDLLPPGFAEKPKLLSKGWPPREDVDGAARMLLSYEGSLSADGIRLFFRLVDDPAAVMARAKQLQEGAAQADDDAQ